MKALSAHCRASEDNTCRIWDARSSQVKPQVYMPRPLPGAEKAKTAGKDEILAASYNPDGRFFVTGSTDKMARVRRSACLSFSLNSSMRLSTLEIRDTRASYGPRSRGSCIVLEPVGRLK